MKDKTGKVLQIHALALYPGYILSVAVEKAPGIFTVYYKKTNSLAEFDLISVVMKGKVLSEEKARELFSLPELRYGDE